MDILDLSYSELESFMTELGEKPYRAAQVWRGLWGRGLNDFDLMTDLSKDLRARLTQAACIPRLRVLKQSESSDGTVKFLLGLPAGGAVESVLIPEKTHFTLCLSTQIGCPLGCTFCATGRAGFSGNLGQAGILGQVQAAREYLQEREKRIAALADGRAADERAANGRTLRNLVLMGMGEPLLNFANVVKALRSLHHPLGMDFSSRRITLSTAGIGPGLEALGGLGICSLAISLHAPSPELRARLMPGAEKITPLPELMKILRYYPLKNRERLTFEYLLLKGVNDDLTQARELVRLLSTVKAKVNLIAYNPAPGMPFASSPLEKMTAFGDFLSSKGITSVLRKSKGQDIEAACGQLVGELGPSRL